MIQLRNLSKKYGGAFALHPTDLEIPSGKVTVLIGPSGCGKSTLLRLILRLIEPSSGEVILDGQSVTDANVQEIRRKVGYVIQDGGLFPHLTARENVSLMARHLSRQANVEELAKTVRFPAEALDRYPLELSGGQRQRVGLMRALALDPSTLLMDEPLGALDPLVRSALQSDLRDIFRSLSKTVVLVTHDMGEAAYLADRIVLLRDGRIVQQGTLQEFQNEPSEPFVTEFLNAQRAVAYV